MRNEWRNASGVPSGLEGIVNSVPDTAVGTDNSWIANYTNKFDYNIDQNEYNRMYDTMYSTQNNPSQTNTGWVNTALKGALQLAPSIINAASKNNQTQQKVYYTDPNAAYYQQQQQPQQNNTTLYVVLGAVGFITLITVLIVATKK